MPDKPWKSAERRAARWLSDRRNDPSIKRQPGSGGFSEVQQFSSGDLIGEEIYVECKHRKKHAAVTLWDDTKKKADKEGKTPVVMLFEKSRPGFWVLVHSEDYDKI